MKLKAVHLYQYAVFNQKNQTFFTDSKQLGMEGIDIEFLPQINAVSIKGAKDHILVFTTNVAYAIPMDANLVGEMLTGRAKIKNNDPARAVK